MDKKKLIKSLTAIIANLAALIAIYFNVHPADGSATKADSAKKDTAKVVAKADTNLKHKGLLSKLVFKIKNEADSEATKLKKKDGIIGKLLTAADSAFHKTKKSAVQSHLAKFSKLKNLFHHREKDWDSMNHTDTTRGITGAFHLKPGVQVYGWHPFWMGSAYRSYNFSLLSTVSYFSYEINPSTGLPTNSMEDWETTPLVDSAKKYNCGVHLTASCMGEEDNREFLSNATAQSVFIERILQEIGTRANGVCLDFENLPASMSDEFVTFVAKLRTALGKSWQIAIAIPSVDWSKSYDVQKLENDVDQFIIMGYDFYGSWSSTSGPVAPLRSSPSFAPINLSASVSTYLDLGVPNHKLLLALPYYGAQWVTQTSTLPSTKIDYVTAPTYGELRKSFNAQAAPVDSAVVSAVTVQNNTAGINQYWFDNATTLGEKYQFALDQKIGGVGIWALGYDNGYHELWNELCTKMAQPGEGVPPDTANRFPLISFPPDSTKASDHEWGVVGANGRYFIFSNPYTLLYSAGLAFFVIVLIQVILDKDPWNELFTRRMLAYLLVAFAGVALIVLLGLGHFFADKPVYAILTGVVLGFIVFRLSQMIVKKKDRLP